MKEHTLDDSIAEARAWSEAAAEERRREYADRQAVEKHENTVQLILGCVVPGARDAVETSLRQLLADVLADGKKLP